MPKKYLILHNPAAGKGRSPKLLQPVVAALNRRKAGYKIISTTPAKRDAGKLLTPKVLRGISDVILIGGDGTFGQAANALAKKKISVGLVPCGTGDDFSRLVYRGNSIKEIIETAVNGRTHCIDLGKVNGRYFLNGLGAGFDGRIVHRLQVPFFLPRTLIYLFTVFKTLFSYNYSKMEITTGNKKIKGRFFLATVANGTTFGNGFKLTPRAKLDDGRLDLCLIRPTNIFRKLFNMPRMKKGGHISLDIVEYYQEKSIVIKSPGADAHLDGEKYGRGPYRISAVPRALRLKFPY